MSSAIRIANLSKHYKIYERPADRLKQMLWRGRRRFFRDHEALKPLSLTIAKGETVGIVGQNGSGKSTLLQLVCGTLSPSTGTVDTQGRISALLELGAGFNPEFTGKENVFLNASILGLSKREILEKYDAIVAFSGLDGDHLAQPVKTYSSGMYVRLAFAVAIAVEPDILVVDEALAVGDEAFQRKCFARLREMQRRGATILFVSHAPQAILELCSRALLFDAGELLMDGAPKDIIAAYHKMIFAPERDRPAIRTQIANGTWRQAPTGAAEAAEAPETRVAYAPNGGEILDYRLTDRQGALTGQLTPGETYQWRYRIRLDQSAAGFSCAMLIKTKTGIELAGAHCRTAHDNTTRAGTYDVVFTFPCRLQPGLYTMNCGAWRVEEGHDIFIHRIVDALEFRVLPLPQRDKGMEPTGMADLGIEGNIIPPP